MISFLNDPSPYFFQALASGMNHHLTENVFIREVFRMEAPLPELNEENASKQSKQTRVSSLTILGQIAHKVLLHIQLNDC